MTQGWAVLLAAFVGSVLSYGGARYGRRKDQAEAVQTLSDTALSLVTPLNTRISELSGQVAVLMTEVARQTARITMLEGDNARLRNENTGLRHRISSLERQIIDLGQVPMVPVVPGMTVTSVIETKTTERTTSE